jgi:curved DNA-binding protein CbpA
MAANAEDILTTPGSREPTLAEAKRKLALVYHPDRLRVTDQLLRNIATERMKEVNAAFDRLKKRRSSS